MNARHTPGPWHTAGDQGVQIRSEKHQIAKIWTMRGDEWKANARLIATAPDLLASLEEVLAYCKEHGHDWLCMAEARAAIAKATGVQHG